MGWQSQPVLSWRFGQWLTQGRVHGFSPAWTAKIKGGHRSIWGVYEHHGVSEKEYTPKKCFFFMRQMKIQKNVCSIVSDKPTWTARAVLTQHRLRWTDIFTSTHSPAVARNATSKGLARFLSLTSLEKLNCKTEYDLWLSNADTLGPRYFSTPFEYYVLVTVQGLKSNTSIIIDRTKEPSLEIGKKNRDCGEFVRILPKLGTPETIPTHPNPFVSHLLSKWLPYPNHCSCISM